MRTKTTAVHNHQRRLLMYARICELRALKKDGGSEVDFLAVWLVEGGGFIVEMFKSKGGVGVRGALEQMQIDLVCEGLLMMREFDQKSPRASTMEVW